LNAVECENSTLCRLPQPFVVGIASLYTCPELVDELWIRDCDLEIWTLLVSLEAEQVFSHHHLYRMNCGLVLSHLCLEVGLERLAIGRSKRDRRCNVEVMQEVGDV